MNLSGMDHYRRVTFTHANLKRPVQIVAGTIVGYHWSDASKAVHVYTAGGTVFPVSESIEQVNELINQLSKGVNKTNE